MASRPAPGCATPTPFLVSVPLSQRTFQRILLIKPTALGDVVHTVPLLVKLRERYPQAAIDWLVTPENAELVRHHPALTRVVLFQRNLFRKQRGRALLETARLLRQLRAARYDLVLDLHGQLRTGLFAWATGSPVRIGFDRPVSRQRRQAEGLPPRGWAGAREGAWLAYTHRLPIRTLQVHAVDRYLWVGELLSFSPAAPDFTLHLGAAAEAAGRALAQACTSAGQPLAILAPGTMWETKHWRAEGFAQAGQQLAAAGWSVAVVGAPKEGELCARVAAQIPGAHQLAGRTSPAELAVLLRHAGVCVTNDSGAMHLAVAQGVPVAAVFGPTNPVTVGPYGQGRHVVRAGVPCSPCNLRRLAECPHEHACMQHVNAQSVAQMAQTAAAAQAC